MLLPRECCVIAGVGTFERARISIGHGRTKLGEVAVSVASSRDSYYSAGGVVEGEFCDVRVVQSI